MSSSRRRTIVIAASVLVLFLAGTTGALVTGRRSGAPSAGQSGSGTGPSPAALAAAAASRQHTGAWITAQVGRSAIVGCDPVMCQVLARDGFPGSNLLQLGPATPDPLGAAVVVGTAAVRSQFGGKLAGVYAPAVLASFGTGTASVQIRVMAPDGAAAYQRALSADLAARRADARQLLRARGLHVSGLAGAQLAAGLVDSRLLSTLVNLVANYQVRVLSFGSPQPGASPAIPLRFMQVVLPARSGAARVLAGALSILHQQVPPYSPAGILSERTAAGPSLSIQFAAPSPLGLLGAGALKHPRPKR